MQCGQIYSKQCLYTAKNGEIIFRLACNVGPRGTWVWRRLTQGSRHTGFIFRQLARWVQRHHSWDSGICVQGESKREWERQTDTHWQQGRETARDWLFQLCDPGPINTTLPQLRHLSSRENHHHRHHHHHHHLMGLDKLSYMYVYIKCPGLCRGHMNYLSYLSGRVRFVSLRPTTGYSCYSVLLQRAWNWNQSLEFILALLFVSCMMIWSFSLSFPSYKMRMTVVPSS